MRDFILCLQNLQENNTPTTPIKKSDLLCKPRKPRHGGNKKINKKRKKTQQYNATNKFKNQLRIKNDGE